MTEHHISSLPVVDVDNKVIGVITEADFISAMDINADTAIKHLFDTIIRKRRGHKKMGTIVDDLMTTKPVTVKEEDTIQRAIELMNNNHIKRLIIADTDNHAKGIVSRADLIRLFTMK